MYFTADVMILIDLIKFYSEKLLIMYQGICKIIEQCYYILFLKMILFLAFDRFSLSFILNLCATHNVKLPPDTFYKVKSSIQFL